MKICPGKSLFWRVTLVQGQLFGTSTRNSLKLLLQCAKRVKSKSQKVLGVDSYVSKCHRGKAGGGSFAPLPHSE